MKDDWFKKQKVEFFKKERKDLLKPKKSKEDFKPEKALKLAGGMILTGGAIVVGTKLLKEIADIWN